MRIDGSIKSLITGVSTVDKSRSKDVKYMRECLNFRNDTIDGLTRRPPAELVADVLDYTVQGVGIPTPIDDFDPLVDVMKAFTVDGDRYWFYSRSNTADGFNVVQVYDDQGVAIDVRTFPGSAYLTGSAGNDSIRLASSGDVTYVVNTKVKVSKVSGSTPFEDNHSMLVLKNSPKVYQRIIVRWENPDYSQSAIQYEVGENHYQQPIQDISDVDTGVNTVSEELATKISDKITAEGNAASLKIYQDGATIVFINTSTGDTLRRYSRVTVEDGTGGAVLAINGSVQDISELPRFSHAYSVLEVKPDPTSNRGQFYMKSEPALDAVVPNPLPAEATSMTVGNDDNYSQFQRGYFIGNYGSVTDTTVIPGEPSFELYGIYVATAKPFNTTNSTTVSIAVYNPGGNNISLDTSVIKYMELWDVTSTPVRVLQTQLFLSNNLPENSSFYSWDGTIDSSIKLGNSRVYKVYFEDVVATYTDVPEVRWVESSAPEQETAINPNTFPHVLYREPDGTFSFGSMNDISTEAVESLRPRSSGNDTTNPMPSVVGNKIKDVALFQNRLALLTNDKVSMSVSGQSNDWFRGTVVTLLDTSPISIQSSSSGATSLTHFVEHNNDLMVFGPSGQFRFSGKIGITPQNASLPQASAYNTDTLAVPVAAGNDVFFSTSYGASAGISQFSLDPQIDNLSVAKPLADLQIGLLEGAAQQIVATPNLGLILVRTDSSSSKLYALEFEPQIDILKPITPTWSIWEFRWGMRIVSMRVENDVIEIAAIGEYGSADDGVLRLYRLNLFGDRQISQSLAFDWSDVHLDARVSVSSVNSTITLGDYYPGDTDPLFDLLVVQGKNSPNPGAIVDYTRTGTGIGDVLTLNDDLGGGDAYYGYVYVSSIELPDFDVNDASGIIQTRASLRITDMDLTLTGDAFVGVTPKHGAAYPFQHHTATLEHGYESEGFERVSYRAQVKQDSNNLRALRIFGLGPVGLKLHQIEYRGTYNKVGRRL